MEVGDGDGNVVSINAVRNRPKITVKVEELSDFNRVRSTDASTATPGSGKTVVRIIRAEWLYPQHGERCCVSAKRVRL